MACLFTQGRVRIVRSASFSLVACVRQLHWAQVLAEPMKRCGSEMVKPVLLGTIWQPSTVRLPGECALRYWFPAHDESAAFLAEARRVSSTHVTVQAVRQAAANTLCDCANLNGHGRELLRQARSL